MKLSRLFFDFFVFLSFFSLFLISIFTLNREETGRTARITTEKAEYAYSLDKERTINLKGPVGTTTVEIKDGTIFVKDSPCPGKTCIKGGKIDKAGQWLCCAPNKIMIVIGD